MVGFPQEKIEQELVDICDDILKIIKKVKLRYLAEKKKSNPGKPDSVVCNITDDDLCPLNLFDYVLSAFENKYKEKK